MTVLWAPTSFTCLLEPELLQGTKHTILKINKFWDMNKEEENTTFETGVAGCWRVEV